MYDDSYKEIEIHNKRYYGQHMILSAVGCNDNIFSCDVFTDFLKTLVPEIDMVPHKEPIVERFGPSEDLMGITAIQMIQTSAIVIHTNDKARELYLDVFSCKAFDEDTILNKIDNYFSPENKSHFTFFRK